MCGGPHNIRRRWVAFVLTSLNTVKELLYRTGQKGGPALKVSWFIFGNIAMCHLCVHYISSRNREESALGPAETLDGGSGRSRDSLPGRWVVLELTVRYQRRIEYKSYSTDFNEMCFHENSFPRKDFPPNALLQNAGKARSGKSKEALVTHSFCRAYCTETAT